MRFLHRDPGSLNTFKRNSLLPGGLLLDALGGGGGLTERTVEKTCLLAKRISQKAIQTHGRFVIHDEENLLYFKARGRLSAVECTVKFST